MIPPFQNLGLKVIPPSRKGTTDAVYASYIYIQIHIHIAYTYIQVVEMTLPFQAIYGTLERNIMFFQR